MHCNDEGRFHADRSWVFRSSNPGASISEFLFVALDKDVRLCSHLIHLNLFSIKSITEISNTLEITEKFAHPPKLKTQHENRRMSSQVKSPLHLGILSKTMTIAFRRLADTSRLLCESIWYLYKSRRPRRQSSCLHSSGF